MHCPKCGKDLTGNAPQPKSTATDVPGLLASANLHRIRAEWDEAIADCTEALRLGPHDPDVPSLLGSIYEERGMLDEALVWFQMALELNPDSGPDRDRLERVTSQIETKRSKRDAQSFQVFQNRTRLGAIGLGVIFVVVVLVAIFASGRNRTNRTAAGRSPSFAQSQNYSTQHTNDTGSALPQGPSSGSDTSKSASTSSDPVVRTPAESYIRSELSTNQAVTESGATINDVTADPRSGGVVCVTFTIPFKGFIAKEQVIRACVAVARKALDVNRQTKFVTVRCVVQAGGAQGTQIAFVGDVARQTVDALPANATDAQLMTAFTRPWWNPQIGGQQAPDSSVAPTTAQTNKSTR